MNANLLERSAAKIEAIAGQGLDVASFWGECGEVLASAVPSYMAPCWFTFDPTSLLVTSHYDPQVPEMSRDFLSHEYGRDDPWKMAAVARSTSATMTVHEATDGHPERSECWRLYVAKYGAEQELMVPLRSRNGTPWATLSLYREPGRPQFSSPERAFLGSISRALADGARRGLLVGEATDREGADAPVLVVIDEDLNIASMTPGADAVMSRLPGYPGDLPTVVRSVAASVLSSRTPTDARIRDDAGRWLTLHGAPMIVGGTQRASLIIEQTDPDRLVTLMMDLYDLTDREKDIARLVLRGLSTAEIARDLFIAPDTVQQHLKHVFAKTAVNSRRELVGKIFFAHYEPRLRDNEMRTAQSKPIRGGPIR